VEVTPVGERDRRDDNPYAAPRAPVGLPFSATGVPGATLLARGYLKRKLLVETHEGSFVVEYAGLGNGERVYVNGRQAVWAGSLFVFASCLEFSVGSTPARIEVDVNVFLGTIRGLRFRLRGEVLYAEGRLA
jgi:hypothetical protein